MKFKGMQDWIKKTARLVIVMAFIAFMTCVTVCADDDVTWQTDPGKVVLDDPQVALSLPGYDHVVTRANVYEEADAINSLGVNVDEYLKYMNQKDLYICAWDDSAWDDDYINEFDFKYYYCDFEDVISLNGLQDDEVEGEISKVISEETMSAVLDMFDGEVYSSSAGDKYYLCRIESKTQINPAFYLMITVRENHIYSFYLTNSYGEASKQELKNIVDSIEYFDELAKDPSRADNRHRPEGTGWWIILVYLVVPGVIALIVVGIVKAKKKKRNREGLERFVREQKMQEQKQNTDEPVEQENFD